jgi:CheY-like chemotaxis protein
MTLSENFRICSHKPKVKKYQVKIRSSNICTNNDEVVFELIPERSVFSLPVKQEDEHMLAVPASGGFFVMLMQNQGTGEHKAATKEEYKKQSHVRTRILIIDDEPDITLSFRKSLKDKGVKQVETVNDPIIALSNFRAGSYDLLIIDIVMPVMDGFSLFEEIRKIDKKVKVCFITAFEVNYQYRNSYFCKV